jgi:hypothetical protein
MKNKGDIIFDDNGDPLFFGDIEAELSKEHKLYSKKFDLPLNPAFNKKPIFLPKLPSIIQYCVDNGTTITETQERT